MKKDVSSALILNKLVFDKIVFKRLGMKNDNQLEYKLQIVIKAKKNSDIYKVTLILSGEKEKEYSMEIELSGYFSFDESISDDEEFKKTLINQNAVAIVMPYLRSQVSLLTAQPNVDCVVLPPFNIIKMMDEE